MNTFQRHLFMFKFELCKLGQSLNTFQVYIRCAEGTCIPSHYVCDGQPDCVKSEDEQNCGRVTGVELANSEIVKVCHLYNFQILGLIKVRFISRIFSY